jgi:hypothetical protein
MRRRRVVRSWRERIATPTSFVLPTRIARGPRRSPSRYGDARSAPFATSSQTYGKRAVRFVFEGPRGHVDWGARSPTTDKVSFAEGDLGDQAAFGFFVRSKSVI